MTLRVVLDTNVISAAVRGDWPNSAQSWFADTRAHHAVTVVTVMELVFGVQRMPRGRKRSDIAAAVESLISSAPILELTASAAMAAGNFRADRAASGRPLSLADAQIAGICTVNGAAFATRNTRDFEGLGLDLVDPWH